MKWEDFVKKCREKLTISEEELNKLFEKEKKSLMELGVEEDKLENSVVARVHAKLKRQFSTPAEKFTGIIVGATRPTDYGAKKLYDMAVNSYKENPEQAISNGLVDAEGNPLYLNPEWKKGQKIDLDDKSRSVLVLIKEAEDKFIKGILNLRKDRLNIKIPFFSLCEFRANRSKKATPELILLNDSVVTEFNPIKNLGLKEVSSLLIKYYKDLCFKMGELRHFHEESANNQNRIVITKGNISRVFATGEKATSNLFELVDPDNMEFSMEGIDDSVISCWLNKKDFSLDFEEGALDVIVVGKTNISQKDNNLSLEIYGMFVDELYKKKVEPEELQEEEVEEEW